VVLLFTTVLLGVQGCKIFTPKAMDVVWSKDLVDDNGFYRNPVWHQMTQTGQPPDPCAVCPCQNEDPQAWKAAPKCTNQSLETNSSWKGFGHWNWLPVVYEGTVSWGGHSNSWYDDDDYYFQIKRSDRALETNSTGEECPRTEEGVHIEFDSEETVDYWDDTHTWWDDFHHNRVDVSDQAARDRIRGKDAIVIGYLGLDNRHCVHSELHPVYAMFVHVQDAATEDRWAFFVRNWGHQGYYGDNQMQLLRRSIRVRIQHPGATSFSLSDNVWVYGDDENERNQQSWTYQTVPDGVLLTFFLRDPAKKVGFVGDLTINWGGTAAAQQGTGRSLNRAAPETRQSRALPADGDGDMLLKSKIDKLDSTAQKLLYKEVKNLTHHPKCQIKRGTMSTSPPAERVKPTAIPNYGTIVKSVADPARRAKETRDREFVLSFLKARGIE